MAARISPKENRNKRRIPPQTFLSICIRIQTNEPKFWQILSPSSFGKLVREAPLPEYGGQNLKRKCPFHFRKIGSRTNEKQEHLFFGVAK